MQLDIGLAIHIRIDCKVKSNGDEKVLENKLFINPTINTLVIKLARYIRIRMN